MSEQYAFTFEELQAFRGSNDLGVPDPYYYSIASGAARMVEAYIGQRLITRSTITVMGAHDIPCRVLPIRYLFNPADITVTLESGDSYTGDDISVDDNGWYITLPIEFSGGYSYTMTVGEDSPELVPQWFKVAALEQAIHNLYVREKPGVTGTTTEKGTVHNFHMQLLPGIKEQLNPRRHPSAMGW